MHTDKFVFVEVTTWNVSCLYQGNATPQPVSLFRGERKENTNQPEFPHTLYPFAGLRLSCLNELKITDQCREVYFSSLPKRTLLSTVTPSCDRAVSNS